MTKSTTKLIFNTILSLLKSYISVCSSHKAKLSFIGDCFLSYSTQILFVATFIYLLIGFSHSKETYIHA